MSFSGNWHTLLEAAEELSPDATLITPLSHTQFRITDTQEHRVIIEILDSDDSQPLQRDQFETLYRRVQDASGGFELDRLPPDAEPYAAVLTLHPQFEIDEDAGIDRDRVLGVDPDKVDDALDVTDLHEQDVYDIDERAYVRKADVNEDVKETRLQGLKDRLAATESEEADALRSEIEDLEDRIDELTSFRTGSEVQ